MSATKFLMTMAATGLIVLGADGISSQTYPSKPIRWITAGAGGGGDFTSRLIAQAITGPLGQPIVIDNRPGGFLPGQAVAQAAPDGYTVLLHGVTFYLEALLRRKAPYDPLGDFSPVALVSKEPSILVVHPSLPAKNVKELIALIKAKPGQLNYGSGGTGSIAHLMVELFKSMTGADILRVPYKVTGQQLTDLAGGQLHMTITGAAAVTPYIKAGRLRPLAITSAQPSALYPGLSPIAATVPGYEMISIAGVWMPARTPEPIINRLNQEIVRALNQPDIREKLAAGGQDVSGGSPEEFAAWMKTDIARMNKVIKEAGIIPD